MALLINSSELSVAPKSFCNPNPILRKLQSFKPLSNGDENRSKSKIGVRITCRVKDFGVSSFDQNVRSYGQFSAPVKQGSRPSKEEEEKQNYYVNMGYAIRTLREEFAELFYRELSFDIYRFVS